MVLESEPCSHPYGPDITVFEGHSAFPDQRMALFRSRFQRAENPLLCPSGAKGTHFAGIFGDSWQKLTDLKRLKNCMVDQVESEPFSTSEFRQQIEFGPKLVQSPIPGYAARI